MSDHQNSGREQGMEKYFFRASADDFKKIPGSPIAYWVSSTVFDLYSRGANVGGVSSVGVGLQTGDNGLFIRLWHEVSNDATGFGFTCSDSARKSMRKWFPCNKGGDYRKWYGNQVNVINWENNGATIKKNIPSAVIRNEDTYFKRVAAWSKVTSGSLALRYFPHGFVHNDASCVITSENANLLSAITAAVNSNATPIVFSGLNPTLNFVPGQMASFPLPVNISEHAEVFAKYGQRAIFISQLDWDYYENSWDFTNLPLLNPDHRQPKLKASYQNLRTHWRETTLEMQRLEEENNRIFIDAYGLQDELTPEVPLREITLTCNPHYRYGGDKTEDELETLLLADTMRELVSYAVGCMLGRYSLDKPGLILANQGETLADYLAQVPQPRFAADDDNVIPMLDGDWFADDITLRLRQFLRVAFGEAHYEDNLAFIEQALNIKGKRNYGLRDYFLGEFYADHVKRYKKRPIYWLFSSPKGSFNALVYMHRYRPDTVSVVLKYLRDYREKLSTERERQLAASINPATSQGDKTRAMKEAERLAKVLTELDDYERDTLYPLATEQLPIDLDDGVKVNYLKFGAALKKIVGLDAKGED